MAYLDQEFEAAQLAASGKAESLFELGLIYASGRSGETDLVEAHKWFNIAAFRGVEAAKARRAEVAAEMSAAEIAQAQRDARAWLTCH